jgi:hypothetical protein
MAEADLRLLRLPLRGLAGEALIEKSEIRSDNHRQAQACFRQGAGNVEVCGRPHAMQVYFQVRPCATHQFCGPAAWALPAPANDINSTITAIAKIQAFITPSKTDMSQAGAHSATAADARYQEAPEEGPLRPRLDQRPFSTIRGRL